MANHCSMRVRRQSKKRGGKKGKKEKRIEGKRTIDWLYHCTVLRHAVNKVILVTSTKQHRLMNLLY